jgi:O-antigen/teichoic acid export membrane protein
MDAPTIEAADDSPTMMKKFFRGAGIIAVTNAALQLKGLVLIPLISKKFGAIGYGAWALVAVLVAMLAPLVGLGIENGFYRYMSATPREKQVQALWGNIVFKTITCGLCALLLWILSAPIAKTWFGGLENASLVALCGLVIYSTLLINDAKSFFRISQHAGWLSAFTMVQGFGNLGAVILAYLLGGGIFEIVAATAVLDLILSLFILVYLGFKYGLGQFDFVLIKKFISYGAVLIPAAYATWALNLSDRLFLAHYRTLQDIGVYSVAYSIGYLGINLFFNPLWMMYPPVATKAWEEGNSAQIQHLFVNSIKVALGFLIPCIVGIGVLGKPIIFHLSKAEFLPGAKLMPLIALGYLFLMFGSYWTINLGLGMKQKISSISSVIAALLNIGLNWLMIPPWGITGAAVATCLSFFVLFGIDFWFGRKILILPLPMGFITKALISSGIMAIIGVMGVSWALEDKLNLIVMILLCSIVYFFLLFCFKAFDYRELKHLKEMRMWLKGV